MPSDHPAVEALRSCISIAAVVGETVELVRVGDRLCGDCPAHRDRERALFVREEEGLYLCFSCGRQGDVVQWVREAMRCSEATAIELLERRLGDANPEC